MDDLQRQRAPYPRPQQAVKSTLPVCGSYRNMTIGLLPEDYAAIEREASKLSVPNSKYVRDLIHDYFRSNKEN